LSLGPSCSSPSPAPSSALSSLARAHGVAGLLYRRLRASGGLAALDPADAEALERRHAGQVARSAVQWPEIDRVLAALDAAGIPVRLLKGAALALTVYENPSDRPMDDLDLLVPEDRIDDAVLVLRTLGFERNKHVAPPKIRGTERLEALHVNLVGPAPVSLMCELHWTLVAPDGSRYAPDIRWFWEPATVDRSAAAPRTPCAVFNASCVPHPSRLLLHLCAHAVLQHPGEEWRLIWFHDIDCVARMLTDWDPVVEAAGRFHWAAAVHAAVAAAAALFGTPLPGDLLDRLAAAIAPRDIRDLARRRSATTLRDHFAHGICTATWSGRLRVLRGLLIPSREYLAWRYPALAGAPLCRQWLGRWWDLVCLARFGRHHVSCLGQCHDDVNPEHS
jgi:hypothetical protein